MRTLILSGMIALTAAAGVAVPATAQNRELQNGRQDIREQQRDLRDAQRYGDRRDVREARADLQDARREYREDWRDYRRDHQDVFRGPAYVGPRGYRYRPLAIGNRLEPVYYGNRYVIADTGRYRLPRATGAMRWVRYGNDAVLVNIRTGRVQSAYNGFFL